MNIQELHNRLIKRASMQKVAGPGADKLRKAIAEINKVRGNQDLVSRLDKVVGVYPPEPLRDALKPYIYKNEHLVLPYSIHQLKSPLTSIDADLNKLIDRIANNVASRKRKIRNLGGEGAANAYEQNILNKYLKDIA